MSPFTWIRHAGARANTRARHRHLRALSAWLLSLFGLLAQVQAQAQTFPLSQALSTGHIISVSPEHTPEPPLGDMHSWVVQIEHPSGAIDDLQPVSVGGGMRAHGHGFYTDPKISEHLGNGHFRVSGVLFNMPGQWQLALQFATADGESLETEFEMNLLPPSAALIDRDPTANARIDTEPTAITGRYKAFAWTPRERRLMRSLTLPRSAAPSAGGDHDRAARLGHRLFFDNTLSGDGHTSCASCHQPGRYFSDNRVAPARSTNGRNAPTLIGVAQQRFFNWDGAHDSLWSQALSPLESDVEMDSSRVALVVKLAAHYRDDYEAIYGELPDRATLAALPLAASPKRGDAERLAWERLPPETRAEIDRHFANIGRALAAYQQRLAHRESRFDHYVATLETRSEEAASHILNENERAGLRLFIADKTQCLRCHNGPNFSSGAFHNIGTKAAANGAIDPGRAAGLEKLQKNPFNCRATRRANTEQHCEDLAHLPRGENALLSGAFKVPSLRNVALTYPYMHDGRFESLSEVIDYYAGASKRLPPTTLHELPAIDLSVEERTQLAAFLASLTAPRNPHFWARAPHRH